MSLFYRYFEDDPFLFKTKSNEACGFHWAIDNGQFCSLSIVKRRVYSIWAKVGRRALMPASGSLAGLEKEAANVPVAVEVLADETDPEVDNFRRAACMKEFVNAFGQQVTRAGTMNGQARYFLANDIIHNIVLHKSTRRQREKTRMSFEIVVKTVKSENLNHNGITIRQQKLETLYTKREFPK